MTAGGGDSARRALLASFNGRGRVLMGLGVWSIVEAVPAFLSGRLVAHAIDHGFLVHRSATGLEWLAVLGASMLLGAYGTRQAYQRLATLVEPFRDQLVARAVTGAISRSTSVGAQPDTAGVARLTRHVEIVRETYAGVLMAVQGFVITTVSALLGMFTLVPVVLVLVLPPLLLGLALFVGALGLMAQRQRASILADEGLANAVSSLAGGLRDIVACGAEEAAGATVSEHIDAQARAARQLARLSALQTLAVALGGWVPVVLILIGGSWLLRRGATTGAILGALTYLLQGVQPALQTLVRQVGGSGMWLRVALGRIIEASEPADATDAATWAAADGVAEVTWREPCLRNITFRYGPWAEPVISNLDLVIPAGDHLAIVGPSGAGKSTLALLISGLLEPGFGEVRTDHRPDGRVLIPQEAYVFTGTLRENLTYFARGALDGAIDEAVDRVGARQLVARLGGYGATVAPRLLSAGERQLITLVRAYLSPAPLVILDEATCHLDPIAEARVEEAFARRDGSLVVIAHRMSSALRARRVLLLDGSAMLLGPHDELLQRSALYRDLVGHWVSGAASRGPAGAASRDAGGAAIGDVSTVDTNPAVGA